MAPLLTAAALLFATTVGAQAKVLNQTTWAAVTYTYHGEKTPDWHDGLHDLTPLGAQQAYNAGLGMRNRYISGVDNATDDQAPINRISPTAIRNNQMSVMGTDDSFVSASAMAFMQALYPARAPPVYDEESEMGDGSVEPYPLNGYQYPNIETVSSMDYNYIWIAGHIDCTRYSNFQINSMSSASFIQEIQSREDYYQSLHKTVMAGFDFSVLNYANAMQIYDYALYQYNHNRTIHNSTDFTINDLSYLQFLASAQQWTLNTPNSTNTVPAIAGRTLASRILQQFEQNINTMGQNDKLTAYFGSYEPMLSFFALSNLATGPSAGRFNSLPAHGSTFAFELFSYGSDNNTTSTTMPSTSDLHVRFLFRNGSDDTSPLISYPLFGHGPSEVDMTWAEFAGGMGSFAVDGVSDWCTACGAVTLFCEAIALNTGYNSPLTGGNSSPTRGRMSLSPAIAGVVGAAVTIAACIFLAAGLLLAGFRIEHRAKDNNHTSDISVLKRSGSGHNGGFKGGDRLASDTDLRLKSGDGVGATVIRHERVGSWELGENKSRSLDKEIEAGETGRVVSTADYGRRSEDLRAHDEDPFGDPVRAVERV